MLNAKYAVFAFLYLLMGTQANEALWIFPSDPPTQATPSAPARPDPQDPSPISETVRGMPLPTVDLQRLRRHAQAITVKVMVDDLWGSGILMQHQRGEYIVLTNQHVLWMGKSYQVQTPDGRIYPASLESTVQFGNNDLGLLKFSSPWHYTTATLGSSLRLPAGTPVFSAGFPVPIEQAESGFEFTTGQISLIMPKAFDGGYQVGYSNTIEKGMSGGPVLNRRGDVIAVNGIHQSPLWGNPYVFQDGSTPNLAWESLARSSWAIPMETVQRHLTVWTRQQLSGR